MKPKFKEVDTYELNVNITPLIDVVFQLLIFFMLTSSFLLPSIKVDLPSGESGSVAKNNDIVVSIDKDGKIYLDNNLTDSELLPKALKDAISRSETKLVMISADKRTPYEVVFNVIDAVMSAGSKGFKLSHKP